jgi:hypothetical protein
MLGGWRLHSDTNCQVFEAVKVKVKSKVFLVHAMKAYRRSRGIASFVLNLGTRWK